VSLQLHNTKQVQKRCLQRMVPTLQIMLKSDLEPISQLKSNKTQDNSPLTRYIFPHSHSFGRPCYHLGTSISPHAIIFSLHQQSPQNFLLHGVTPQPSADYHTPCLILSNHATYWTYYQQRHITLDNLLPFSCPQRNSPTHSFSILQNETEASLPSTIFHHC
jgi:hypothetical protein